MQFTSAARRGTSFEPGIIWNQYFCVGAEVCDVGDFNGDKLADIVLFTRSTYGNNERAGDVEVALSNGFQFVNTNSLWHKFFCIGAESCQTGDFNGDGKDDIVSFTKGSTGKVYVELSIGYQFGDREAPAQLWQNFFCAGNELCDVGDVNGDGKDDILSFLQGGYAPPNQITRGDVYAGLSTGSEQAGGFQSQKWADFFCDSGELCDTGFFNTDSREDIVAFNRSTGAVFVAMANAGTGYYFKDSLPVPPDARKYWLPLIYR